MRFLKATLFWKIVGVKVYFKKKGNLYTVMVIARCFYLHQTGEKKRYSVKAWFVIIYYNKITTQIKNLLLMFIFVPLLVLLVATTCFHHVSSEQILLIILFTAHFHQNQKSTQASTIILVGKPQTNEKGRIESKKRRQ